MPGPSGQSARPEGRHGGEKGIGRIAKIIAEDREMEDTILTCEDSLEGILTAVYRAYEWRLKPACTRVQAGEGDMYLFAAYRRVESDAVLAGKVADTVRRRFGEEAWEDICYAAAMEDEEKGQAIYQTIAAGLAGEIRGRLMTGLANDHIRRTFELSRRAQHEAHRMKMFLRFREVEGGILFARIEPDVNVMAFIMPHFADRFPLESFVILDTRRGIGGIHAAGEEWFLLRMEEGVRERFESLAEHYSEEELKMGELFRCFCHSLGIKERTNLKLQQQFLPLKYRSFMTEFENGAARG